jgi:hypothetical protein
MREQIDIEAVERLAGKEGERTEYILVINVECGGMDKTIRRFPTLNQALEHLKQLYEDNVPCAEHDQILIWEVLPSGHRKVVWHFSGWHYDPAEYTLLPQGALPGDAMSLYEKAANLV